MANSQILVPDIGADSAEVIEILIAEGEDISAEQSVVVLESDKASLEVPAPFGGKVGKLHVKVGDQLSEGMVIADMVASESAAPASAEQPAVAEPAKPALEALPKAASAAVTGEAEVRSFSVPDIGSDNAEVIEVSVAAGDEISEGDTICVAESDKASLEIPAEAGGIVKSVSVKVGDKVSQGSALIEIEVAGSASAAPAPAPAEKPATDSAATAQSSPKPQAASSGEAVKSYSAPDIGSDSAEVIEVSVAVGDQISEGDTICVAESDKASLEIPAEESGEVVSIAVKVGDKISQGSALLELRIQVAGAAPAAPSAAESQPTATEAPKAAPKAAAAASAVAPAPASGDFYAGPAVRKLARELGVELSKVPSTGARGRILKDDLQNFVKSVMKSGGAAAATGSGVPAAPVVDWSKFGPVRAEPMTKIQRLTADNMTRCWLNVPHVTQFDDADVTELEDYRAMLKAEGASRGTKMTPVAFILKLTAKALKENPKFNSSIHADGTSLVYRDYCHLGLAVDTPAGLMVPVIRDADQKNIWELAADILDLAGKAKEGKLKPNEMQGACFTISSLGAIGGRGFTPIVPAPQVGILGVSKTAIQPVWDGHAFVPRKLMPLALSYDHRAVNGGDAGKFLTRLVELMGSADNLW